MAALHRGHNCVPAEETDTHMKKLLDLWGHIDLGSRRCIKGSRRHGPKGEKQGHSKKGTHPPLHPLLHSFTHSLTHCHTASLPPPSRTSMACAPYSSCSALSVALLNPRGGGT